MAIISGTGAQMEHWDTGQAGGIFAGAVAALAVVGKGLAWLLNWNESRSSGREARLSAWEQSLLAREKAYREEIEAQLAVTRSELGRVEVELGWLREVLAEVTAELHRHAPGSTVLTRAARALGAKPQDTAD